MSAAAMAIETHSRRSSSLDPALVPTHNLLEKWGHGYGGSDDPPPLHPLEKMRLLHDGAVLGGGPIPPPKEIEICERIVNSSPPEMGAFLKMWYRDPFTPVIVKADRLGIARATIYTKWKEHLQYIRGRLHGHGVKV